VRTMASLPKNTPIWSKAVPPLFLIFLIGTLIGLPEFFAPISGDTSIFAYLGREIAAGKVLYRDFWDIKTPGIYYLFAAIFKVFPDCLLTLRVFALLWNIAAGIIFWIVARRFFKSAVALVLTGFFVLWTNSGGFANSDGPYPETFMPLITLIVYLAWFRYTETEKKYLLFLIGILTACLILLKQTGAMTLIGITSILILRRMAYRQSIRKIIADLVMIGMGVIIVLVPWPIYFWSKGALVDLWKIVFQYPALYAAATTTRQAFINALKLFLDMVPPLGMLYVMVPIGLWVFWNRNRDKKLKEILTSPFFALTLWAFLELFGISAARSFFDRFLLQSLPALLLIAGIGIEEFMNSAHQARSVNRVALFTGLSVAMIVVLAAQLPRSLHWIDHRIINPTKTLSELIAEYLAIHSEPYDSIFAWGDHRIPYVSHRRSGIKYITKITWIDAGNLKGRGVATSLGLVEEILSELQANPPKYYVESPAVLPLHESFLGNTAVEEFVRKHYQFKIHIDEADLYIYQAKP